MTRAVTIRAQSETILILILLAGFLAFVPQRAGAAQKAFFLFQSSGAEAITGNYGTNVTITLTFSNASGTINNAVFADGASVVPAGQGVSVTLNSSSPPVADGGGTATLPLTISATAADLPNTSYQIIISATNSAFTANVPSGIASITNTFMVGPPPNSNSFSISLSPSAATVPNSSTTNFNSIVTLMDYSAAISGLITNGVTISGPDTADVTAILNDSFAALTNNFGQTNLTLTINVNSNTTAGAYTITVSGTNNAFVANSTPGIATATFTLTVFAPGQFTMGIAPTSEAVPGGMATNINIAVTFTNVSGSLTQPLTNNVTVIGPDMADVTAILNSPIAMPPAGGGTASLSLTIADDGYALPGNYEIIVTATNGNFTANSPVSGTASTTNLFIINPVAPPSISQLMLNGTALEIAGANGLPGRPYVIFSSTNLALPLAQWIPVFTNAFDTGGNFDASFGIANISNSIPQQFFLLSFNVQARNNLGAVATPVFSPAAGPYYAETPVAITSATPGATIRYTTDGTTPTESYGMIYTGPITMHMPYDTNFTGFLTNCSGVTMLKAAAYVNGMTDSAVFTGNFNIIDPLKYPPANSVVVGIAHIAYQVTSSNWASTLNFWTNYFGYAAMIASNNFALIKINDQQYIELYQVPQLAGSQWQLANWGFQVTNAEAYREQLFAAGVSVPPGVGTNALGNLSFLTVDPDGHTNEWIQYLTNSITGQAQGQYMPGTQLFGYINGVGDCTTDATYALPDNYYIGKCNFNSQQTHDIYIPNCNAYVECLTAPPGGVTQALAGKHEKVQLLNFRGRLLGQTLNVLTNRNPSITVTVSVEGTTNTLQQDAADVYDLDGSRARMVDE
jgi:hypothetical protein